jgi:hypothetical protein
MAQPLRTAPGGSASMSFKSWRDPFLLKDQLSTDERLLRDTAEHGRSEVRQELAYAAQERWLVKRSLLDKFEVDASTLTIMAHCIP